MGYNWKPVLPINSFLQVVEQEHIHNHGTCSGPEAGLGLAGNGFLRGFVRFLFVGAVTGC